jgi:hypothetical protein
MLCTASPADTSQFESNSRTAFMHKDSTISFPASYSQAHLSDLVHISKCRIWNQCVPGWGEWENASLFFLMGYLISLLNVISEQCSFNISHFLKRMVILLIFLEVLLWLLRSDLQFLSSWIVLNKYNSEYLNIQPVSLPMGWVFLEGKIKPWHPQITWMARIPETLSSLMSFYSHISLI